jgi:acyl-coenzyme A synthetase/AMP-(fatty) acid ligase
LKSIEIDPVEWPVWENLLRRRRPVAASANTFWNFLKERKDRSVRGADLRSLKMLHNAGMAGLVKPQRGIGSTDESPLL